MIQNHRQTKKKFYTRHSTCFRIFSLKCPKCAPAKCFDFKCIFFVFLLENCTFFVKVFRHAYEITVFLRTAHRSFAYCVRTTPTPKYCVSEWGRGVTLMPVSLDWNCYPCMSNYYRKIGFVENVWHANMALFVYISIYYVETVI